MTIDTTKTETETNVKLKGSDMSIDTMKTETETDDTNARLEKALNKAKDFDILDSLVLSEVETLTRRISTDIGVLYTKDVANKFALAEKVVEAYNGINLLDTSDYIDVSKPMKNYGGNLFPVTDDKAWNEEVKRLKDEFINTLPFTNKSADKFYRIGTTPWLIKFPIDKLPNDYSTLAYLTSKEVNADKEVLMLVKESLNKKSNVSSIKGVIKEKKDERVKLKEEEEALKASRNNNTKSNTNDEASDGIASLVVDIPEVEELVSYTPVFSLAVNVSEDEDMKKVNNVIEGMKKLAEEAGLTFIFNEDVVLAKAA